MDNANPLLQAKATAQCGEPELPFDAGFSRLCLEREGERVHAHVQGGRGQGRKSQTPSGAQGPVWGSTSRP